MAGDKAKIYLITRFSIYSYPPKKFPIIIRDNSEEQYKKWLFNDSRMLNKFDLFEEVTVPSIKHQTYKNYEWLIYTSKELPEEYLDQLKNAVSSVPNTKVIVLEPGKIFIEHFKKYDKEEPYVSVRLDDDDGLNPNYFQILSKYTNPGVIISPKHGRLISRTAPYGHFVSSPHSYFPKCGAWGLALSGGNVYTLGNHATIHSRLDVEWLNQPDIYLLSIGSHLSNASVNSRTHEKKPGPFDIKKFLTTNNNQSSK
jgi:hypothetical protein